MGSYPSLHIDVFVDILPPVGLYMYLKLKVSNTIHCLFYAS